MHLQMLASLSNFWSAEQLLLFSFSFSISIKGQVVPLHASWLPR